MQQSQAIELPAELAAALGWVAAGEGSVQQARTARDRSARMVADAEAQLGAAALVCSSSRENRILNAATEARTGQPSGFPIAEAARRARAQQQDAAEHLEVTRAAHAMIEAELDATLAALQRAREQLKAAAGSVPAGTLARLLEDARAKLTGHAIAPAAS